MKIGIVGAGQLGRMLAVAGFPYDLQFEFLDSSAATPAGRIAPTVVGAFDDAESLHSLAARVDLLTYEFENVPVDALRAVAKLRPCLPPLDALRVSQDRLYEKELFRALGIATPPFRPIDSERDLETAIAELGLPAVLKTRRLGYDGRGQRYLRVAADVEPGWQALKGAPLILEGFVEFDSEVSIIGARSTRGEVRAYPLTLNTHRDGILRVSRAPAADVPAAAEEAARRVVDALDYVGVLALELFEAGGAVLANELAPRVHNSGHWTIEGAVTSQFANHVRAVLGLPLGSTELVAPAAMVNLIGGVPDVDGLLALPGAHVHLYGKAARPGRKLGHVTLVGTALAGLDELRRLADAADA